MKNLTVTQKFLFLVLSALVGILVLAGSSLVQMNGVYTAASYASVNSVPSLLNISEMSTGMRTAQLMTWKIVGDTDATRMGRYQSQLKEVLPKVNDSLDNYEKKQPQRRQR